MRNKKRNTTKRMCYECGRYLSVKKAIEGQRALNAAIEQNAEFEDWVHACAPNMPFLQHNDFILKAGDD